MLKQYIYCKIITICGARASYYKLTLHANARIYFLHTHTSICLDEFNNKKKEAFLKKMLVHLSIIISIYTFIEETV